MGIINNQKRVKKLSPIVNYNGFQEAWNNLPNRPALLLSIRREFQKRLGWSKSSFNYKRTGESPLRENEIPVIKEVFNRYNINPWNGERI